MSEMILFFGIVAVILACIPNMISKFILQLIQYLSPNVETTNIKRRIALSGVLIGILLVFFILPTSYRTYFIVGLLLLFVLCLVFFRKIIYALKKIVVKNKQIKVKNDNVKIYPIIAEEEQNQINQSIKISFTGDLILLRDMVENAYENGSYNFSSMFEHVEEYWKNSDLAIGVLEGPIASGNNDYTNSIYSDKVPLHINFPYSFGEAIKNAGINLVTVANNHMLDKGVKGFYETLDNLDKIKLEHIGGYRNKEEKNESKIKIINIKGLKIAILTYTYGSNNYSENFFFEKEKNLTNIIVSKDSKNYRKCLLQVEDDFKKAKGLDPNCIIVIPHMGEQFRSKPDLFQREWCKIFCELGADIIFSDHTHHVQPIEWKKDEYTQHTTLIVHCPGNFVNSYTDFDGDASIIIEAYLNPNTAKPFAVSFIPIYAYSHLDGNYIGLPIYKAVNDISIRKNLSKYEYKRLSYIHEMITEVVLNTRLKIDNLQEKYYIFNDKGYVRNKVEPIDISNPNNKDLLALIEDSETICFIGDSITEGSANGGYGWYEPIVSNYYYKKIHRIIAQTIVLLKEKINDIISVRSDLYVIAIGSNDIRYRNEKYCAMNSIDYINDMSYVVDNIVKNNDRAKFVFVSPWVCDRYDIECSLNHEEKENLYYEYSNALEHYCDKNNFLYINPSSYIYRKISEKYIGIYMMDFINPNAREGIRLYSEAVVMS